MEKFEIDAIKISSIEIDGGGDTHIHPYGPKETDFTITTRFPNGVEIHDRGIDILKK